MAKEAESYVELRQINKFYGGFQASKDINLDIPKGKLVALLGPSGSGKTTILRMIAGLETPDSGDIIIDGRVVNNVPGSQRGIGFVFQNYALFRYLTVYENIAFGLRVKKAPKAEIDQRVHELLELIDCQGLEQRYPSQLSGGQRQRVAFARALAPNPRLLLLDEPFAAIDAKVRHELRTWLRNIINQVGITSIFVTHDQEEAIEVADQIIVTNQGQVEQVGSPMELYSAPATPFVAKFIGSSVVVEDYDRFKFFCPKQEGSYAILRPEFIQVYKKDEQAQFTQSAEEGVVEDLIFRGSSVEVRVRLNGLLLSATRGITQDPVEIGERVNVFIYRLYVVNGQKVTEMHNRSIRNESVII
jgi:sulfate transport system ATP-binding protein